MLVVGYDDCFDGKHACVFHVGQHGIGELALDVEGGGGGDVAGVLADALAGASDA